jgi:all-trans-retinol 13,14-reductase
LNKSAQDLGIKNTNLWIYPGYDHDENVSNYQSDQEAEFPVVYVSFPSAKDPVYQEKYPNNATMEAITLAPWSWWDKWENGAWKKRGDEYEAEKENLSQRILSKVFKHVPKAKDALDYYELSTPLTVKSLANYPLGEMYGINHTPKRFKQRWLKPKTEIKGLYITGQDMFTVGVSSALLSGLVTVSSILKKNMFKTL